MTETQTEQTCQENETETNIWDASIIGLETNTHLRSGLCRRALLSAGGFFGCGVLEVQTVFMS